MRLPAFFVLVALAGCGRHRHAAAPPREPSTCETLADCTAMREAAREHLRACHDRRTCDRAEAEVAFSAFRLVALREQAEATRASAVEEERRHEYAERDAERAQEEEQRRAADEAAWAAIDLEPCRQSGDAEACAPLVKYQQDFPDGAHRLDVYHAREAGAVVARAREADERERQREAVRKAEAAAKRTVRAAPPQSGDGGHVQCCDGTLSPTCTTVHRGCCSHHGGVCN